MPLLPRPTTAAAVALAVTAALVATAPTYAAPISSGGVEARATSDITVYPLPSTGAGLGRITTAPNGVLWFVERSSHRLGRVTPEGRITEIQLPSQNPSPQAVDLDITAGGLVWVVYDSGRLEVAVDDSGQAVAPVGGGQGFSDTLATSVRVAPDGVVWNAITYPADGRRSVARRFATGPAETPADGAPACDGPIGVGSDGAVWCRSGEALLRADNPPQGSATLGSQTFLAPSGGLVPFAMTGGPAASIWFTRYAAGGDPRGEVGYVDPGGGVHTFATGSGTAPQDLVRGPDGGMWFTVAGARPGIGRVDPTGQVLVVPTVGFAPTSLTFAGDGSLWFTDATHDQLVRLSAAKVAAVGTSFSLPATRRPVPVRRGRAKISTTCSAAAVGHCAGTLQLRTAGPVRAPGRRGKKGGKKGGGTVLAVARPASYDVAPGGAANVRVRLTGVGRRLLARRALTVEVVSGSTVLGQVRLRAPRRHR